MKIPAVIMCPHCKERDGFSLEMEDVNTKVVNGRCRYCDKIAFKIYAFSLYEVDKEGNLVNDQDLKTFD